MGEVHLREMNRQKYGIQGCGSHQNLQLRATVDIKFRQLIAHAIKVSQPAKKAHGEYTTSDEEAIPNIGTRTQPLAQSSHIESSRRV